MSPSPADAPSRMPAEWEPHRATWIAWPHHEPDWPGKLEIIPWVYGEIVRILSRHEPVNILITDPEAEKIARHVLEQAAADLARIRFWIVPTDRSWMRDSGPIFTIDDHGGKRILDWRFNGWAKYADCTADDRVPAFVAEQLGFERTQPMFGNWRIVLEGGSIDVNGRGSLLTTEECLLSPDVQVRNPGCSKAEMEKINAGLLDGSIGDERIAQLLASGTIRQG